ncbi:hypothetical protein CVIRNUC_000621 [Coccomyxa viridis]|uniref:Uncharacterized protein n=1 Tax=Coccomyxa viridis TaxID=1274662 RepID=A0AAV1HUU5_9CHLO|nr:hypothetical protein CVIRNUC_000621 [Coccomyxa viridis]
MEGKMENGAAEADDAEPASSETLVLDDDATEYHEHLHVHFAPGQLSLGAHHIGDYMPQHQDPSRSKRGSFAPGHLNNLLGSSSSSNLLASSSLLRHASSSMRHSQSASTSENDSNANSSSSTGAMQSAISWTLGSMHHNSHLQQRCNTPISARLVQQRSTSKQRTTTPVHENRRTASPARNQRQNTGPPSRSSSNSRERRQQEPGSHHLAAYGYQPHTLEDFRAQGYDAKRERYWVLGTLGADVDTQELQSKRDKAERIRHLSQSIRERNQALADSSGGRQACSLRAAPPENGSGAVRERMQEYARTVQRAAVHNRLPSPPKLRGEDQPLDSSVTDPSKDMKECLFTDIGELEALYMQQKLQVEQMCSELLETPVEGMSLPAK